MLYRYLVAEASQSLAWDVSLNTYVVPYPCVVAASANMFKQYYRTVTFDALLGGGKLLLVLTPDLMAYELYSGGRAG